MRFALLALIFVSSLIAVFARAGTAADSCTSVDFRSELGPPRDQGDTSWCFAHTSADLVSQSIGQRVSAFDLAAQYLIGDVDKLKNSSNPEVRRFVAANPDVIKRIVEDRKEPDIGGYGKLLNPEGEGSLYDNGGSEDGSIMLGNVKGFCSDEKLPGGEAQYVQHLKDLQAYRIHSLKKNACLATPSAWRIFGSFAEALTMRGNKEVLDWVDQKCSPRIVTDKPQIPRLLYMADDKEDFDEKVRTGKLNKTAAQKKLMAEIDANLDRGRVSAIGFSAYDLQSKEEGDDKHGDHSAVIAARRKIDGQCRYFVRNSWGQACGYKPALEKYCEKSQGGTWVTASQLKSLYAVTSMP